MADRLIFILGEALVGLRRHVGMAFAAISTVAVALFLLGGLAFVYQKADAYARTIPGKFEMRVFLRDHTNAGQIHDTALAIRQIKGVASAVWIPRDLAWAKEKVDHPELTEGLENPYPDAFKVQVSDLHLGDKIATVIAGLPAIDPEGGVQYLSKEQHFIDDLLRVMRYLGTYVGGLLFVVAGVLIYNAIRLTIVSRRLEIRIMQLVGATWAVITVPFLIEGMIQGALGGLVAAGLLKSAHRVLEITVQGMQSSVHFEAFPFIQWSLILTLFGAGYGLVCSLFAVRAPLRSR